MISVQISNTSKYFSKFKKFKKILFSIEHKSNLNKLEGVSMILRPLKPYYICREHSSPILALRGALISYPKMANYKVKQQVFLLTQKELVESVVQSSLFNQVCSIKTVQSRLFNQDCSIKSIRLNRLGAMCFMTSK